LQLVEQQREHVRGNVQIRIAQRNLHFLFVTCLFRFQFLLVFEIQNGNDDFLQAQRTVDEICPSALDFEPGVSIRQNGVKSGVPDVIHRYFHGSFHFQSVFREDEPAVVVHDSNFFQADFIGFHERFLFVNEAVVRGNEHIHAVPRARYPPYHVPQVDYGCFAGFEGPVFGLRVVSGTVDDIMIDIHQVHVFEKLTGIVLGILRKVFPRDGDGWDFRIQDFVSPLGGGAVDGSHEHLSGIVYPNLSIVWQERCHSEFGI
jgi:hypothetical protein